MNSSFSDKQIINVFSALGLISLASKLTSFIEKSINPFWQNYKIVILVGVSFFIILFFPIAFWVFLKFKKRKQSSQNRNSETALQYIQDRYQHNKANEITNTETPKKAPSLAAQAAFLERQ